MLSLWVGFLVLVFVLLAVDLGVFHRKTHAVSIAEAGKWTVVWISLGVAFTGVVYAIYEYGWFGATLATDDEYVHSPGGQAALMYLTGYVLEKALSIDNIFVIAVVFDTFRVDPRYRHRVLYWGILGALVLRGAMILSGVWLLSKFSWLFYLFGAYLAFTGFKLFRSGDEEPNPEDTLFVRTARKILPIAKEHDGPAFSTRAGGHLQLTPLALVLLIVEGTDVIFALDSIPAILAITTESFIVFTSNIFAILGLRSLFFILQGMMGRFAHLKISLAFILVFIGAKMALHTVVHVPNLVSLGVIGGAVAVGIISSTMLGKAAPQPSLPDDRA
jgi:tellurite resistance protein TerC